MTCACTFARANDRASRCAGDFWSAVTSHRTPYYGPDSRRRSSKQHPCRHQWGRAAQIADRLEFELVWRGHLRLDYNPLSLNYY